MSSIKGWVGVDLDGTLAEYHGFQGPEVIGAPVPKMVEKVQEILARGIEVRIFTARVANGEPAVIAIIEAWSELHIGRRLRTTNVKDYEMWCLYDDRAIAVEKNTGKVLGGREP